MRLSSGLKLKILVNWCEFHLIVGVEFFLLGTLPVRDPIGCYTLGNTLEEGTSLPFWTFEDWLFYTVYTTLHRGDKDNKLFRYRFPKKSTLIPWIK